ncbi:MAG: hypothetical protein ABGX31_08745, partial [bacterium]
MGKNKDTCELQGELLVCVSNGKRTEIRIKEVQNVTIEQSVLGLFGSYLCINTEANSTLVRRLNRTQAAKKKVQIEALHDSINLHEKALRDRINLRDNYENIIRDSPKLIQSDDF